MSKPFSTIPKCPHYSELFQNVHAIRNYSKMCHILNSSKTCHIRNYSKISETFSTARRLGPHYLFRCGRTGMLPDQNL
jgi:hypothetical protein